MDNREVQCWNVKGVAAPVSSGEWSPAAAAWCDGVPPCPDTATGGVPGRYMCRPYITADHNNNNTSNTQQAALTEP